MSTRKRPPVTLIVGVVLAVLTAVGVLVALAGRTVKTQMAPIATTIIPARTQITASEVKLYSLPVSAIPPGTVLSKPAVVGSYARHTVLPGQTFQRVALQSRASLTYGVAAGDRVFGLPLADTAAVGGQVTPGSEIDIIAVAASNAASSGLPGGSSSQAATTVLQHVAVLSVQGGTPQAQTTSTAPTAGTTTQSSQTSNSSTSKTVYDIAVTPTQAQTLALALTNGDTIYISLDPIPSTPVTLAPTTSVSVSGEGPDVK
jgi:Flp pilus assembly protein CpaB